MDFGGLQLGPQFAYGDGSEYAVDFECGILSGGDVVQSCVNTFLDVSKGKSVSASLVFENDGNSDTLSDIAVAAHSYPEPLPASKTSLIVGLTLGGAALASVVCALSIWLVRKKKCCKKKTK